MGARYGVGRGVGEHGLSKNSVWDGFISKQAQGSVGGEVLFWQLGSLQARLPPQQHEWGTLMTPNEFRSR